MKDSLQKWQSKRNSKGNSIVIECKNLKGNLIRKKVGVSRSRVLRHVGHQNFLITPVVDNNLVVGYAVEAIKDLSNAFEYIENTSSITGRRAPKRRVPTLKKEIYDTSMLPDGIYVCGDCKRVVKPGHNCSSITRG